MAYIDVQLDAEPTDLAEQAYDYLEDRCPAGCRRPATSRRG